MSEEGDPGVLRGRLAVLHPPAAMALGANPFGKDVANLQLWQALARHGGYEQLDVLTFQPADPAELGQALFGESAPRSEAPRTLVSTGLFSRSSAPQKAGALLRGTPDLYDLAWSRRRRSGDRAYSLLALIHTLAPPTLRQALAMLTTAPCHPWDALICTSPSVRQGMAALFDGFGEHLAERTGGKPPPAPSLPVVPLGVDADRFAGLADRPDARARVRARLGLAEDTVLILWVGRLSFYEKAFPQAMFRAVQQAKSSTGAQVAFAMAGWFPTDKDRGYYEEAARAQAPDVPLHLLDGNDAEVVGELWAGADVFLSLVDNIQETFGITPLEAMAAGLPVVASDWDGYRFTVRHGVEGFLIPTLGGPSGGGQGVLLAERHHFLDSTYQAYVGAVAQHTAVHVGKAAAALAELIASPDLRRRMGAAGRARAREAFDWPVVARLIHDLTDDLAAVRAASADPSPRWSVDPVKGDPFRDFAHFATDVMSLDTRLTVAPGATAAAIRDPETVTLDRAFPMFRASTELCAEAFEFIAERGGATVREVLLAAPQPERRGLELGLAWMAKCGLLDWLE